MESYTPLVLPYYAPADILPAPLPDQEEILSSRNYLSSGYHPIIERPKVVGIGEHFVVKYGRAVSQVEGETMLMLFVKKHTTIPVPEVYAIIPYNGDSIILIMENVKGKSLKTVMRETNPEQLEHIAAQLRAQMDQLRRIPAPVPGYYGTIGYRPFYHTLMGSRRGPFSTIREHINAELDASFRPITSKAVADVKKLYADELESTATARGHDHPVFTHGDLHTENILVRPDGTPCLIDYGQSGFCPAYHEYVLTKVLMGNEVDFLDEFPDEYRLVKDYFSARKTAEHNEFQSRMLYH